MIMRGSIHQEDIVTPNVNGPRGRAGKYVKQKLRCEEREESQTHPQLQFQISALSCLNKWQNNQAEKCINYTSDGMEELNSTVNWQNLIDVCRALDPARATYPFLSTRRRETERNHILGHRNDPKVFSKAEIMQRVFLKVKVKTER